MDHFPDVIFHQGFKDCPCCLFIHGLGMSLNIWTEPEKTGILTGKFPITVLLSTAPKNVDISKQKEPLIKAKFSVAPSIKNRLTTGLKPRTLKTVFHDLRTSGSSEAPHTSEHHNLALNHARILFDPSVRKTVSSFIRTVC